jgi:hypothetical protein
MQKNQLRILANSKILKKMISAYKDLMILLSNFDLDRINFQSDNSTRFD